MCTPCSRLIPHPYQQTKPVGKIDTVFNWADWIGAWTVSTCKLEFAATIEDTKIEDAIDRFAASGFQEGWLATRLRKRLQNMKMDNVALKLKAAFDNGKEEQILGFILLLPFEKVKVWAQTNEAKLEELQRFAEDGYEHVGPKQDLGARREMVHEVVDLIKKITRSALNIQSFSHTNMKGSEAIQYLAALLVSLALPLQIFNFFDRRMKTSKAIAATVLTVALLFEALVRCKKQIDQEPPKEISYCKNLTAQHYATELIVDEEAMDKMVQHLKDSLSGRDPRIGLLTGVPGAGKTQMWMELARRIQNGQYPELADVQLHYTHSGILKSNQAQNYALAIHRLQEIEAMVKGHESKVVIIIDELGDVLKDKEDSTNFLTFFKVVMEKLTGLASTTKDQAQRLSKHEDGGVTRRLHPPHEMQELSTETTTRIIDQRLTLLEPGIQPPQTKEEQKRTAAEIQHHVASLIRKYSAPRQREFVKYREALRTHVLLAEFGKVQEQVEPIDDSEHQRRSKLRRHEQTRNMFAKRFVQAPDNELTKKAYYILRHLTA